MTPRYRCRPQPPQLRLQRRRAKRAARALQLLCEETGLRMGAVFLAAVRISRQRAAPLERVALTLTAGDIWREVWDDRARLSALRD